MRRIIALLVALFAGSDALLGAPQKRPVASAPAQISATIVALLRDNADKITSPEGNSVLRQVNGVSSVYVLSGRSTLLFAFREARRQGAQYAPSADALEDVVRIICGSSTRVTEIFECSAVVVLAPNGDVVPPVSYDDRPTTSRNAMGAKWVTDKVFASYRIDRLREGFTVRFENRLGMKWTEQVTPDQAWSGLLLGLEAR